MGLRKLSPELVARWRAEGIWRSHPLDAEIDRHAAAAPARLALADQHRRITYADLVDRSSAFARRLLELGLDAGDAVAVQAPNSVALGVAHVACNRANLIFVPLSDQWGTPEIVHLLRTAQARAAFVPGDRVAALEEERAELASLVHLAALDGGDGSLAALTEPDGGPPLVVARDPGEPRFVMVTSGTTGAPRMSLWTDDNLWFFLSQYADAVRIRAGDVAVGLAPANTGSVGYVYPVFTPLLFGASSVLLEHWSPSEALELLAAEGADLATAVPTQLIKMLQDPSIGGYDWSRLRVFTNAGAAMPPDVGAEVERAFGCVLQTVYGSTDGGVPVMTRTVDPPQKRFTTVGRLLPETDLRLVDPDLRDVPPGEAGEIVFRNPTKTLGYLNDDARTEEAFFGDGWYRSGDLGRLDDDGYLSIVGRVKDVIIRGGQNLSPREVEDLVATHPAVSEVSVIGLPDPVYGERACACVALRPGESIDLRELVDFLQARELAKFKLPERLEVFEELPKSAGGKISKVELRQLVMARHTTRTAT